MKTLFSKKKLTAIILLCAMLGTMAPAQIASATYYQYGATFNTYSHTATFMKLGKKYRTKKQGFHYYRMEIPVDVEATVIVYNYGNSSVYVDTYNKYGGHDKTIVGDLGWKRVSGKYRNMQKIVLRKGVTYFRVHKTDERLATLKVRLDNFL